MRRARAATIALSLLAALAAGGAAHAGDEPGWREQVSHGCLASCEEGATSEGQAAWCTPFCACLVREIDDRKTNRGAERFLEQLRRGSSLAQRENQEITEACLAELQEEPGR